MIDLENIKSKVILMAACSIIIFSMKFIFHYFFPGIPISELGPASALPPVLGLMFGVWGAAGAAIGYSASEMMVGYSPEIYIISFFIQFLYAYIPYKLWYTLNWDETTTLPRLDTVKHLVKFVIIMFINAAIMAGLLGFLMDGLGLYDLISLTTLIFAVNNFDFSIMFGTLILIAANFYGIRMYRPKKVDKTRISPKIFDLIAVLVVVISIINGVYSAFTDPNILGWIAGAVTYSLILIYMFRPITSGIRERTTEIKMSLTENLIVIFIIMGAIIAILTGIRSLFLVSVMDNLQFWDSVYLNITLILSVFYIASIAFLWYIEQNISTPIESISDIVKNYVSDSDGMRNNDAIISRCEQYAAQKSEVGILASSFQKMTMDLEIYMKNLKNVTAEKERINTELNVAKRIQEDMLPRRFPAFPERDEFDIYAMNIPAKEVGGDFYDFFLIDENHLAIVIADVSGKGVPAALFMVVAKTLIKDNAQLGKNPAEVFNAVNNHLCEGNDESMFVTAWMGILEIETGKFTYVNAGHNSPLLKRANNEYTWLKSKPGFVLAGIDNIQYHQNAIALEPGDRVYLYTDGVTEASNCKDELFGDSRLLQIMNDKKDLGLKELVSYVKREVDDFVGEREQFDDITMLIMEYKK